MWFTWLEVVVCVVHVVGGSGVCGSRGWRCWCMVHVVGGVGVWSTWLEVVVCGSRGWR